MTRCGAVRKGLRWWRFHSATIGCDFVVCEVIPDTSWEIRCEDGVRYDASEAAMLMSQWDGGARFELPLEVHILKKMTGGRITHIERKSAVLPSWLMKRSRGAGGKN